MDQGASSALALQPGTRIEVRSRFDQAWKRGFEIETVTGGGYLVRRLSDGAILPVLFADHELRAEPQATAWR